MIVNLLRRCELLRRLVNALSVPRNRIISSRLNRILGESKTVVDIGAGTCQVDEMLMKAGHKVTPVDIQNISFTKGVEPIIYDGKTLPFPAKQFDVALIVVVLHHISDQEIVIGEAKRVAKKLIITEEIYSSFIGKYVTYFFDSLVNLEFNGHPHSNRTDLDWRKLFRRMKLRIVNSEYHNGALLPFMRQVTYVLE